jgi:hypothetical protein
LINYYLLIETTWKERNYRSAEENWAAGEKEVEEEHKTAQSLLIDDMICVIIICNSLEEISKSNTDSTSIGLGCEKDEAKHDCGESTNKKAISRT